MSVRLCQCFRHWVALEWLFCQHYPSHWNNMNQLVWIFNDFDAILNGTISNISIWWPQIWSRFQQMVIEIIYCDKQWPFGEINFCLIIHNLTYSKSTLISFSFCLIFFKTVKNPILMWKLFDLCTARYFIYSISITYMTLTKEQLSNDSSHWVSSIHYWEIFIPAFFFVSNLLENKSWKFERKKNHKNILFFSKNKLPFFVK